MIQGKSDVQSEVCPQTEAHRQAAPPVDDSCPSHHGNLSLYLVSTKFQSVVDKVELSSNSALAGAQTCPGNPRHTTNPQYIMIQLYYLLA